MKGTKLKIGIDVDDVLFDCIGYILKDLNKKENYTPPISIEEFTSWEIKTDRTEKAYHYFETAEFYKTQPVFEGAKELIFELLKFAEVFIISAPAPEFMSIRAKRIMEEFPAIPKENIILGARKDIMDLDILFDDGSHNILKSRAKYPVLKRRPWNRELVGCLSVTNYPDFLKIVEVIRNSYNTISSETDIICLVGPTGSGKNEIAKQLSLISKYKRPIVYTSRTQREVDDDYISLSAEDFNQRKTMGDFFEMTYYGNEQYGIMKQDVDSIIEDGNRAVVVTDICGAMTFRTNYPNTKVVYVKRQKKDMLRELLLKSDDVESKVSRLLSLDREEQNEELCDISIKYEDIFLKNIAEICEV
ncbi:MAG: hypothetical protein RR364_01055 [Lachnospiraceae bacterium]